MGLPLSSFWPLNGRDIGRATNKDDLVNLTLVHSGILRDLLDGMDGSVEGFGVGVLDTGICI